MSLFRANTNKPFHGPHQNCEIITAGSDLEQADSVMIMVHGRGASAQSILKLAETFSATNIHYIAPQAMGSSWYPYSFLSPIDQNQPGIDSGLQLLHDIVTSVESKGFSSERILFLGFSQGACLSSEYVARHPKRYGGLIVLSGGLIGHQIDKKNYNGTLDQTPVFIGCSDIDPHIPEERVHQTAEILSGLQGQVNKVIYQGMGHTVNQDEIMQVNNLMNNIRSA